MKPQLENIYLLKVSHYKHILLFCPCVTLNTMNWLVTGHRNDSYVIIVTTAVVC